MKVIFKMDVSDEVRRALRFHRGRGGLATRADMRNWIDACVNGTLEGVMHEYRAHIREKEQRAERRNRPSTLGPALHNDTWPRKP